MSLSNKELVEKAIITTEALANAGRLNPAQSSKFIDFVIDETVLKNNARIIKFRNQDLEIEKIGVGTRVAVPKAEAQDPGVRRGIVTSKVTLRPVEIMVPFEIGDVFKEENIEGEAVEERIVKLMATAFANDLESLYINGDKLGLAISPLDLLGVGSADDRVKDSYLALADGWSRLADSANIVDAQGANIGLSIFGQMLRAMPTKFRRNKANLRWYLSPDLFQLFEEKLATRATDLGDRAAAGASLGPFGVKAVPIPLWENQPQVVEHVQLTGTDEISLRFGPVSNVIVNTVGLDKTAETPFIEDTDYSIDFVAGTITRIGAGAIGAGDFVKVTYDANPQIILTHRMNFIIGIGRDIRIEKDRDIFKGVNQYAITVKVTVNFEELDAIVKAKNIGTDI